MLLAPVVGATLIGFALVDMFSTLLRPGGFRSLSIALGRALWFAAHRLPGDQPRLLGLVGPLTMIGTIATWAILLTVGWALVYWPYLPDEFLLADGLTDQTSGFMDALYVSLVTLTTLGYGDIVPTATWLRIVGPLEGVVGFLLLSAGISWVISTYPVLSARRALAYEVSLLSRAWTAVDRATVPTASDLSELTTQLISVRRGLMQFPVTYYFRPDDDREDMAMALHYLHDISSTLRDEGDDELMVRAGMLDQLVTEMAEHISTRYLRRPVTDTESSLVECCRDHLRPVSDDAGLAPR